MDIRKTARVYLIALGLYSISVLMLLSYLPTFQLFRNSIEPNLGEMEYFGSIYESVRTVLSIGAAFFCLFALVRCRHVQFDRFLHIKSGFPYTYRYTLHVWRPVVAIIPGFCAFFLLQPFILRLGLGDLGTDGEAIVEYVAFAIALATLAVFTREYFYWINRLGSAAWRLRADQNGFFLAQPGAFVPLARKSPGAAVYHFTARYWVLVILAVFIFRFFALLSAVLAHHYLAVEDGHVLPFEDVLVAVENDALGVLGFIQDQLPFFEPPQENPLVRLALDANALYPQYALIFSVLFSLIVLAPFGGYAVFLRHFFRERRNRHEKDYSHLQPPRDISLNEHFRLRIHYPGRFTEEEDFS